MAPGIFGEWLCIISGTYRKPVNVLPGTSSIWLGMTPGPTETFSDVTKIYQEFKEMTWDDFSIQWKVAKRLSKAIRNI